MVNNINGITVKCIKCTKEQKNGNILYNLEKWEIPEALQNQLSGIFINGKCPICKHEILIGVDYK